MRHVAMVLLWIVWMLAWSLALLGVFASVEVPWLIPLVYGAVLTNILIGSIALGFIGVLWGIGEVIETHERLARTRAISPPLPAS